jgi:hypothetical protein
MMHTRPIDIRHADLEDLPRLTAIFNHCIRGTAITLDIES